MEEKQTTQATQEAHEIQETETTQETQDTKATKAAVFQICVTKKDLMDFKLYHNYHSVSGIAAVLFGLIALFICIYTINQVNISYTLMMGFFGLFFTVWTPIGMLLNVNKQMKKVSTFQEPVIYTATEDKITLQQGDIKEEMLWDDVFKIKCTGKSLILYITSVRANVIPLESLGDQAEVFFEIASKKLKPFQIKVNQKKVIAKANNSKNQ